MATGDPLLLRLQRLRLRWSSSTPHLSGASIALLVVIAALLGVLETLLLLNFDARWWVVVLAAYLAGWSSTAAVLWLVSRIEGRRVRSWASIVYPPLAPAVEASLHRDLSPRQRWWLILAGGVVVVAGSGLLLYALVADQSGTLANFINALVGFLALVQLLSEFLAWLGRPPRPGDSDGPIGQTR